MYPIIKIALLRKASIAYLLLPNIIFSVGWFKWQLAVPLALGYLFLLGQEIRKVQSGQDVVFSARDSFFLLLFSIVLTLLSGVGGFGYETNDYWAHNARFNELYLSRWPIYFPQKDRFACYYFGFFLLPALFSKVSHELSISALFLWTSLGFCLGLHWVYALINKNKFLLLIFIFIGWFGHPLTALISRIWSPEIYLFPFFLDIWSVFLQVTNVPNQVIPTLITCGILLHDTFIRKTFRDSFLPITLCFIWCVFPSVVLVVIFGIISIQALIKQKFNLFQRNSLEKLILPGLLFIPNFIYLLSSDSIPISGFVWQFASLPQTILHLSLSAWLTLLVFYGVTISLRKFNNIFPSWFIYATYGLAFLSTGFRMGVMNDWGSRSTIAFIIIINLILLNSVSNMLKIRNIKNWKLITSQAFIILFLLINHIQFFNNFLHNNYIVRKFRPELSNSPKIPFDRYTSTYQAVKEHCSEAEANQYLGKKNSVYERFLSK